MSQYLLGVDCGSTVTKAVVFDTTGREIGTSEVAVGHQSPHPRWVERDMDLLWEACEASIVVALANAGVQGNQIAVVAPTAHGDGLYLIDDDGRPVRPAILSLDSRAFPIVDAWRDQGVLARALSLTGQEPFAASPAPLLAWLKTHEPDTWERTRWVLSCKDWIRFTLTGHIGTDFTEASLSFTDVATQRYSEEAFALYDESDVMARMPPVSGSTEVIGEVLPAVARKTELRAGTPVVAGIHDVDASAIGTGCVNPGQLAIVAGTWSINEVISTTPVTDPRWACRNFVAPGQWMNMAYSPASATNLEWFVRELCSLEVERATAMGISPFTFVNDEIAGILAEPSPVIFHPFLYGSAYGDLASAAFLGVRGWHGRGHLLRAILEGVVFNHRVHIEALRSAFPVAEARLSGGGGQSAIWSQMFADALDLRVSITDAREAGARGAAMCGGVGVGLFPTLQDAADHCVRVVRQYEPDAERTAILDDAYASYQSAAAALEPVWARLG